MWNREEKRANEKKRWTEWMRERERERGEWKAQRRRLRVEVKKLKTLTSVFDNQF